MTIDRKPGSWIMVDEKTGEVKPDMNDAAMAERVNLERAIHDGVNSKDKENGDTVALVQKGKGGKSIE